MKSPGWSIPAFVALLVFTTPLSAQLDATALNGGTRLATNLAGPAELRTAVSRWQPKIRDEHQTEWFSVRYTTNAGTGRVRATTNSYVELATGLNRPDALGGWQRASAAFQITATGAEANLAGHRVRLAGNLNTAGAVQIEKGEVKMQGHPLCIAYYDPVDGRSELLAELKDATGWLVSSNEVVYSNCFNGIRASVRYRNSIDGLEQDLILHERPPVTPAELGFSSRTRLELFTEWIGDTPLPQQETRLLATEKDTELRKQMVEPDFMDSTLTFGPLRMGRGKAFAEGSLAGGKTAEEIVVGKRFEIIDGRKILIEALPVQRVQSMLNKLPAAPLSGAITNAAVKTPSKALAGQVAQTRASGLLLLGERAGVRADQNTEHPVRLLPAKRLAQTKSDSRIQSAAVDSALRIPNSTLESAPAFVLDWQALSTGGLTDYTFHSATTYLCTATINLSGTTRFQGGTVIKFAPAPAATLLKCLGPVICETEPYRPAFFVSKFDATVGEILDGNTTPAMYSGAIELTTTGNQLRHLRVRHASVAIRARHFDVQHSQFTHCGAVFDMPLTGQWGGPCKVGNVLVDTCDHVFGGAYYYVNAAHLTVKNCVGAVAVSPDYNPGGSLLNFINSLLVIDGGIGAVPYTLTSSHILPGNTAVFQTVGSASHYLAPGSTHRGQGITSIDPVLLAELKNTTTYPPLVLSGTVSANTTLAPAPQVIRNATVNPNPDRGYAYPVIDYWCRALRVENATLPVTLLATNGVIVAVEPGLSESAEYGIWFGQNAQFISMGSPVASNLFLFAHAVHENPLPSGHYYSGSAIFRGASLGSTPNATIRFTDIPMVSGAYYHMPFDSGTGFYRLSMQDTSLRGGKLYLSPGSPL